MITIAHIVEHVTIHYLGRHFAILSTLVNQLLGRICSFKNASKNRRDLKDLANDLKCTMTNVFFSPNFLFKLENKELRELVSFSKEIVLKENVVQLHCEK